MYYALYNSKNGYVTITCVQWFDESDYIESRFIKNNEEIYEFFSYIDDVHINNEDDNYSYQSDKYSKNLEKLKFIIENDLSI